MVDLSDHVLALVFHMVNNVICNKAISIQSRPCKRNNTVNTEHMVGGEGGCHVAAKREDMIAFFGKGVHHSSMDVYSEEYCSSPAV